MKAIKWTILLALLGFVSVGMIKYVAISKEPSYHGRSLDSWLDEWATTDADKSNQAARAIRAIGSNAVPILLAHLTDHYSRKQLRLLRFMPKFIPWERNPINRQVFRRVTAAFAINLLGMDAKSAFPTLTNLFWHGSDPTDPAIALAGLGHEGVAVLLDAATNQNRSVRFDAIVALREARSDLDEIIPALVKVARMKCSTHEDYIDSGEAGGALVQLHTKAAIVVPILLEFLDSEDAGLRGDGARLLGNFGTNALTAVPQLLKAREDVDASVREWAEESLQAIDPSATPQTTNAIR